MIVCEEFSFQYQGAPEFALRDLSFTINKGDFIGITGSSGAGKSTLLSAFNGIVPHHYTGDFYGSVMVAGHDTLSVTPEQLSRYVGTVFQDIDAQMVTSVVEDEILFGLENFGVPADQTEARLQEALALTGISELRCRTLSSLSGGQKQKVAIAAIAALKPEILLLDEPTGELDPKSSQQIFEMLRMLNRDFGITILVVEQKIMLLSAYVEKLMILHKGKLCFFDETRQVLRHGTELLEIGVNCPRIVTLANHLYQEGLYHGPLPLCVEDAAEMIKAVDFRA